MRTKPLFIVTAVFEVGTGLALMISPPVPVSLLLGSSLDGPASLTVARIAGAALLALGLACWIGRSENQTQAMTLTTTMLFYNAAASAVLVYAGTGLRMTGVGLWPAVVVHLVMAAWCLACLAKK